MGAWLEAQMKKLEIAVERRDLGTEKVKTEAGETEVCRTALSASTARTGHAIELTPFFLSRPPRQIPLPPVLLGQYGSDPKKKTLCVYGHYDVQPASKCVIRARLRPRLLAPVSPNPARLYPALRFHL
jgi:acetylornithine deacetylase/succinyl-diaminopimelate desuccinylase-like protein